MKDTFEENVNRVGGHDFILNKEGFYTFACLDNVVCKVDKQTKTAKVLLANEDKTIENDAFARLACIGNTILVVPHRGKDFYLIDTTNDEIMRVDVNIQLEEYQDNKKFWQVVCYKRFFYIMGYLVPVIIKIDAKTYESDCITGWVNEYIERAGGSIDNISYYFSDGYAQIESDFYFPTMLDSTVFRFNVEKGEFEFIKLNCKFGKVFSMAGDRMKIWMVEDSNFGANYIVWDTKNNTINRGLLPSGRLYYDLMFYENHAYFFPIGESGIIYKVEKNSLVIEQDTVLEKVLSSSKTIEYFFDIAIAKKYGNEAIFVRRPDNTWFKYNFVTKRLDQNVFYIESSIYLDALIKRHYDDLFNKTVSEGGYFSENLMPLVDFVRHI